MRLASGSRVVSARFDAAGLQISDRLRRRAEGFELAGRNIENGLSMIQTAEGGYEAISENLMRLKELALQSMSGTVSPQDRLALDAEVQERIDEIVRLTEATEFNGFDVLNGDQSHTLQVGPAADDQFDLTIMGTEFIGQSLTGRHARNPNAATALHGVAKTMLSRLLQNRAKLGAAQNRLESMLRSTQDARVPLEASASRIADADMAEETAAWTRESIIQQASVAVLAQAMRAPELALQLLRP